MNKRILLLFIVSFTHSITLGIDYYGILGVPRTASKTEIKKAHRTLFKKADVDRQKELNEAFEILGNPEKRRIYDQFGAGGIENYERAKRNLDKYKRELDDEFQRDILEAVKKIPRSAKSIELSMNQVPRDDRGRPISSSTRIDSVESMIRNRYVGKEARDAMLLNYLDLAKAYQEENEPKEALRIINEILNKHRNWGGLSVNQELINNIHALQSEFRKEEEKERREREERERREAMQKAVAEANRLIGLARPRFSDMSRTNLLTAINVLKPYLPDTASNIVEIYIKLVNEQINNLRFLEVLRIRVNAFINLPEVQKAKNLAKFSQSLNDLDEGINKKEKELREQEEERERRERQKRERREALQKIIDEADKLINRARPRSYEGRRDLFEAIRILEPYLPDTASNIMQIYIKLFEEQTISRAYFEDTRQRVNKFINSILKVIMTTKRQKLNLKDLDEVINRTEKKLKKREQRERDEQEHLERERREREERERRTREKRERRERAARARAWQEAQTNRLKDELTKLSESLLDLNQRLRQVR